MPMSLHHVPAVAEAREVVGAPGTGVTDVCEHLVGAGDGTQVL